MNFRVGLSLGWGIAGVVRVAGLMLSRGGKGRGEERSQCAGRASRPGLRNVCRRLASAIMCWSLMVLSDFICQRSVGSCT